VTIGAFRLGRIIIKNIERYIVVNLVIYLLFVLVGFSAYVYTDAFAQLGPMAQIQVYNLCNDIPEGYSPEIMFDKPKYTWTDRGLVTIDASVLPFPDDKLDVFGPVALSTKNNVIEDFVLYETAFDSGVFYTEIILTGFSEHDADGDGISNDASGNFDSSKPYILYLPASDKDFLELTFPFCRSIVTKTVPIEWNIGQVAWLNGPYSDNEPAVVQVFDPDMNLDPKSIDTFTIDVWSDSDAGGIDLTVTETGEATRIFEGTVQFTTTDESSGSRLRVTEGDTITAEYEDNTLPNPYKSSDELDITVHSSIKTSLPPETILDNDLKPHVNNFVNNVNSKIGQNFISFRDMNVIGIVTDDNKEQTMNELIQKTIFLDLGENTETLTSINQFPNKAELGENYLTELTGNQEWPFAEGSKVQLLQTGDIVAEISWTKTSSSWDFNTIAILDKNGQVKFEPLMYFSADTVLVHGSEHTLTVTNFLGWTTVKVILGMNTFVDPEGCEILTAVERIPKIESLWAAPIWYADVLRPSAQKYLDKPCYNDQGDRVQDKNFYCADAQATAVYSAFFPNWKISPTEVEIKKGDLPMSTGIKTLTKVFCTPEFPLTSVLILVIAISGIIVMMKSKSYRSLLTG
jgi:hypothetical protein